MELPNAIDSEKSLLWSMIIDESIINLVDLVKEDFYEWINGKIYDIIKQIKHNWLKLDLVILKEYLENNKLLILIWWLNYLIELTDIVPSSSNWQQYRDIIKEKSDRRKIIRYAQEIQKMWIRETNDMKEILHNIENISDHIFNLKEKDNKWDIEDYVNKFEEMREKVVSRKWMIWIHTIFPEIDKFTKWFIEWKVYTLVAYSNIWKSKMSYNYASNFLKQWKKVMYISLEVDKAMLFSNILANYYKKQYHEILDEDFTYNLWDFENLEIYDDIYKLQDIKTLVKSKMPDIVFIDFIQNIQEKGNEVEKMTTIAQEIQQLAINTWISFFNLSQANNDSRFKESQDIQPKWSGAIFASSDVIFALQKEKWLLHYSIIKNKYWPAFKKFLVIVNETYTDFKLKLLADEERF